MIATAVMTGKSWQALIWVPLFGLLFIWVGAVRLKDTLARRSSGSFAGGVVIGSASIALGVLILLYCVKLGLRYASTQPTP